MNQCIAMKRKKHKIGENRLRLSCTLNVDQTQRLHHHS